MKTFLVIEENKTDQFIHEQVLKYCGAEEIKSFDNISNALDFLKNNELSYVTMLLDLATLLKEDRLFTNTVLGLKEFKGELELYIVSTMVLRSKEEETLKVLKELKAVIEKPLTVEKATVLLFNTMQYAN